MATLINPWELESILTHMRQGTYSTEEGFRRLLKIGLENTLAHTFAFQIQTTIEQFNDLTKLANKADETHLDNHTAKGLIDLAYQADLISQGDAFNYLTDLGMNDEIARHHLETEAAIKNKNASRAEYLERPTRAKRYCTVCGRQTVADNLSNRGLCMICRVDIGDTVVAQMAAKSGPYYNAWRMGMMAYAYELEDEEIAEQQAIRAVAGGETWNDLANQAQDGCDHACESCPDDLCDLRKDRHHECDDDCEYCSVRVCSLRTKEYAADYADDDDASSF